MCSLDGPPRNYALSARLVLHSMSHGAPSEEPPYLSIRIESHLGIGTKRRSQVVMATLESGKLLCPTRPEIHPLLPGARMVAKIFDPELIWFSDGEWTGSRIGYCSYLSGNEV